MGDACSNSSVCIQTIPMTLHSLNDQPQAQTVISQTRNPCAFQLLLTAALALNGCEVLRASENPAPIAAPAAAIKSAYEERVRLDSGVAPASDQANGLLLLMAYNASVGACGDIELGPLK